MSLRRIYGRLLRALGPQGWWPARSPFEVILGAVLTQATRWHNAEQALARLRREGALRPRRLLALPPGRLARAVRPAGFFRQKARRLRAVTRWYVARYGGRADRMFRRPWRLLREELLAIPGIGPETADTILLYAGGAPVFVVDAYTRRVLRRHRLIGPRATDEAIQQTAMRALGDDAARYNECHALLVELGKRFCHRRDPECGRCPLGALPHVI